jgi:hypothetical protein
MHKKPGSGKKTDARNPRAGGSGRQQTTVHSPRHAPGRAARHAPKSIHELLDRGSKLRQIVKALPEQKDWSDWLREQLPDELAAHVLTAVPRGNPGAPRELVLLADSAVWCARLRYALAALEEQIRARDAAIGRISVRVGRR